ncbi:CAF17-like 4Fe-4S cluster assembly/insertion protein YgfZ [Chitinasiproducens palmae]|uniref:Uncharacterized protein n=1 Tax=Chitinasiproducens palmae TaxID=1770053 RepID=A0A1H2PWN3_9BURK|nr:folate-binding protein YgfZ [Chitinasiproducens palmae]SDV51455.1 hypothetical protein SAMN05216551_11758 [Chitinasiproducens palmae]
MTDDIFHNAPPAHFAAGQASIARLDSLRLIDVVGADALSYLHNLLTNDVEHLDTAAARLGGFCSPKGRLLATFVYWRLSDAETPGVRLLLSADLHETMLKRLRMYVLRSKVSLSDASATHAVYGVFGEPGAVAAALARHVDALPDTTLGRADGPDATVIRLSDVALETGPQARYLWIVPGARAGAELAEGFAPAALQSWEWLEVRAGEPRVVAATSDRFVPQMINYEALGGVSFRKGCYPGQEVVARSQYRGTVKRRATLAHAERMTVGSEIFVAGDGAQPAGLVVLSAPAPTGGVDAIVELKIAARDAGVPLAAGAADGPPVALLPLPYALPSLD